MAKIVENYGCLYRLTDANYRRLLTFVVAAKEYDLLELGAHIGCVHVSMVNFGKNLNYRVFKSRPARDPVSATPAGDRSKCRPKRPSRRRQLNSLTKHAVFYAWIVDELSEARIEPSIAQRYSIGAACDLVQSFDDPMPANAYELLVSLAAAGAVRAPADRSYASGAICLKGAAKQASRVD
jgi:hypothetical protein